MGESLSIQNIVKELRAYAEASGEVGLRERVKQLEQSLAGAGSISVGNITGSTAVAIGSDIQIVLHQTSNLPQELLAKLMNLTDNLYQQASSAPHASGHIRVFLASPGDVKDERKLALKAISKIGADPYYKNLNIEAIAWDKPGDSTPILAGIDPQRAIREGLAQPADCDICAAIFWSRMGTPLDHSKYQKADGSQYLSGTEWELENALEGFQKTGFPLILIYRRTEKISLDPDDPKYLEKGQQWKLVKDFLDAKNPDDSIRQSYNAYSSPSEFSEIFELHLRKLIVQVVEKRKPAAAKPVQEKIVPALTWPKDKSPFPGLRAFFGTEDAKVYFGRGEETDLLLRRLADPNCHFLAVVGASGSGKSSLVGAGLLPRLQEGALPGSEDWPVMTFTPDAFGDGNPFTALISALSRTLGMDAREAGHRIREKASGLRDLLEAYLAKGPAWKRAVIFMDQFEELFTRVTDESMRNEFSLLLSETARSPRILTVVTLRDDFYHYCVKSPVLSRVINRNADSTSTLSAPDTWDLYEMVTSPARVAGLTLDEGLAARVLEDTGSEPGSLALMAFALDQLYKASREDGQLTMAAYRSFGGVQGAIGTRAQETFEKLSEDAKKSLPHVFRELLDVDESGTATRKRALLEKVERDKASRELAQALVEARLLVTSRGAENQALVEVAHEALFRSWPRLNAWIEEAQDDLILLRQVRTAADWWNKHGRQAIYLWPDERLKPKYEMQKRLMPNWSEHEKEFIRLEAERLLEEIDNPATTHHRRSWIGERLDTLGDPRPGVGLVQHILPLRAEDSHSIVSLRADEMRLWGDKAEHVGLPDIVWLKVSGGKIQIENQTFQVQPYYIAKYPITYRQFETFVEAKDGFKDSHWWKDLSASQDQKSKPDEQNFKFYNHPRENVSWYDAIAFCRWLNARLRWPNLPTQLDLNTLEKFSGLRLPTEWEWQWAASGEGANYEYPWGMNWDSNKANTSECGLARTTAAGMYPSGAAKCNALDMSGNVEEWCLNEYSNPEKIALGSDAIRVGRGSSWLYGQGFARVSYRYYNDPHFRYYFGFRHVVRPPSL